MAHLRTISPRQCQRCDKPATKELFSVRNDSYGLFCDSYGLFCSVHADIALKTLDEQERQRSAAKETASS